MKGLVCVNNKIVPSDKARISVFDKGLQYGHGVFETMRAYCGRIFLFEEHMERLNRGARCFRIAPPKAKILKKNALLILKKNNLLSSDAYLKIMLTPGDGGKKPASTIIISRKLDTKEISLMQKNGITAITLRGWINPFGAIKSMSYARSVLGKIEAEKRNAFEAIFTTPDGYILEGASTNVFLIKDEILKTPEIGASTWRPTRRVGLAAPSNSAILRGVTRDAVIQLAKKNGLRVKEMRISVKDLYTCDEAFVTNSIMEIIPLKKVDSMKIGKEKRKTGPITALLLASYKDFALKNP
ncbi:MAG: aminotransferase class IV [Thermodesulfobacteriota bacterium]